MGLEIVEKRWGKETIIIRDVGYMFKMLELSATCFTSLHYHEHKHETLVVVSGQLTISFTDCKFILRPKDYIVIPPGKNNAHRMTNHGKMTVVYYEASTDHFDDSIRVTM